MNEATCKANTTKHCKLIMPGCVVLRHEDLFRAGIPDTTVTWHGRTTWWESKVSEEGAEPKDRKVQRVTCLQLAGAGVCYYVIFTVSKRGNLDIIDTSIVHPREVVYGKWPYDPIVRWPGLAYRKVAEFIRSKHP